MLDVIKSKLREKHASKILPNDGNIQIKDQQKILNYEAQNSELHTRSQIHSKSKFMAIFTLKGKATPTPLGALRPPS